MPSEDELREQQLIENVVPIKQKPERPALADTDRISLTMNIHHEHIEESPVSSGGFFSWMCKGQDVEVWKKRRFSVPSQGKEPVRLEIGEHRDGYLYVSNNTDKRVIVLFGASVALPIPPGAPLLSPVPHGVDVALFVEGTEDVKIPVALYPG